MRIYPLPIFWLGALSWMMVALSGCNYHYHTGLQLGREGRFEEANIEFRRAYTMSPDDADYREAFLRTAAKTSEDLLERYHRYVRDKKYEMAFRRLEQARTLTPHDSRILEELNKWYRILVAGEIDLVQIKSLHNQIPLSDQIQLTVWINTPNALRRLEAPVNYQSGVFYVEDILYDPPQDLLMMYTLHSIGVKLINDSTGNESIKRFVDFKTPVLIEVRGTLEGADNDLISVSRFYPFEMLRASNTDEFWYPSKTLRYALMLDSDAIKVSSSEGQKIGFLPQILYINKRERRYFLDFGQLQLFQKRVGGAWSFRRLVDRERDYLRKLQQNLLLNTYFYYREGGYPYLAQ